mgnify:CR=1 FL=1
MTNRNHRGILENQTGGKAHPLGVIVQTDDLLQLLQIRTYRDMLFFTSGQRTSGAGTGKSSRDGVEANACNLCKIPPGGQAILFSD